MHRPHSPTHRGHGRACAQLLEDRVLLSATLIKDLNTHVDQPFPTFTAALGDTIYYFPHFDPTSQEALWKSDGSGAQRVKAMLGPTTSPGGTFGAGGVVGNSVVFQAWDPSHFFALWRTDGTEAGTVFLKELNQPEPDLSGPAYDFTPAGGKLFFATPAGIWVTDGTATGTSQIFSTANPVKLVAFGNRVAFLLHDSTSQQIFVTDASGGNPTLLKSQIPRSDQVAMAGTPDALYFETQDGVWKSDGTVAGMVQLSGLTNGPNPPMMAWLGSGLVFSAQETTDQQSALFASDGTAAGTSRIAALNVSDPRSAVFNGKVLFAADNASLQGSDLWVSDGTSSGTHLVQSNIPLPQLSLGSVGDMGLFTYDDHQHGTQVWETDGTTAGTVMLTDVNSSAAAAPGGFFGAADVTYFMVADPAPGAQLWETDGTRAGTKLVADFNTADDGSDPVNFQAYHGAIYFDASGDGGNATYVTDGAAAGTYALPSWLDGSQFTDVNGITFFVSQTDFGLWRTDGTQAGTFEVLPQSRGNIQGNWEPTYEFAPLGDKLYFLVHYPDHTDLGTSDGTTAGTSVISGGFVDRITQLHVEQEVVRFVDLTIGALFQTDGTRQGTVLLSSPPPLPEGSTVSISGMNEIDGAYYVGRWAAVPYPPGLIHVYPQYVDYGVYKLTPSASVRLTGASYPYLQDPGWALPLTFGSLNGDVYFDFGLDLYRTDGTSAGTIGFKSIGNGHNEGPLSYAVAGGKLYIAVGSQSSQLWVSDGTTDGTQLLRDFGPSTTSVAPGYLTPVDGLLFFIADDGTHGTELWVTDGTAAGTQMVQDINPGAQSSDPSQLTAFNGKLFFAANDSVHGDEPWVLQLTGSVSGSVFNDANHNGTRDAGENGLAGVTVFVDTNNNGTLDPGEISATTDSSGNYMLANVPADVINLIRQVAPAGWRRTAPLAAATGVAAPANGAAAGPVFGDVQVSTVPMDFNYLLTLAQHYGQPGTFATGDVTGDGQVNFDDLLLVAQNYGHPLPTGAAAVPATDTTSLILKKSRSWARKRSIRQ